MPYADDFTQLTEEQELRLQSLFGDSGSEEELRPLNAAEEARFQCLFGDFAPGEPAFQLSAADEIRFANLFGVQGASNAAPFQKRVSILGDELQRSLKNLITPGFHSAKILNDDFSFKGIIRSIASLNDNFSLESLLESIDTALKIGYATAYTGPISSILFKSAIFSAITKFGDFNSEIQTNLLENFLGFNKQGQPASQKDPYELSTNEIQKTGLLIFPTNADDFCADIEKYIKTGTDTRFSGHYNIPSTAKLTATLGNFTAKAHLSITGHRISSGIIWKTKGTFFIHDIYDFNINKEIASEAWLDFIRANLHAEKIEKKNYEDREMMAELKTAVMSVFEKNGLGKPFKITSPQLGLSQNSQNEYSYPEPTPSLISY